MSYYCGIDLGNKRSRICVIDGARKVRKEVEVKTEGGAICKELEGYGKLECIVEASPLAEWLCKEVECAGHKIEIVCARKAKVALESQGGKKKTDRRDAHGLAELCRSGWFEGVHRKSEEARAQRSVMTARKQLVEASVAIASSIRGILRAHGVRLLERSDGESFVAKASEAAAGLPREVRLALKELIESFELLQVKQRTMYSRLQKKLKNHPVAERLMTIPGVGAATAAAFIATIDEPNRFPDGEKVASYVGLVPSVYQSGDTEYRGRITKSGDKLLRWLLVEAAHVLLTRSHTPCQLRRWGLELKEKKGAGKARVAVARRLCMLMWKLWTEGGVFHAESLQQAA